MTQSMREDEATILTWVASVESALADVQATQQQKNHSKGAAIANRLFCTLACVQN